MTRQKVKLSNGILLGVFVILSISFPRQALAAPVASFDSWVEVTGTGFTHPVADQMFFNPDESGSFTLKINATDAGPGMDYVAFPSLGTNWSPAGANIIIGNPYEYTYSFSAVAADPGVKNATAFNTIAEATNASFTVTADSGDPTGGSIAYGGVLTNTLSHNVTYSAGTDSGSGVDSGGVYLQRRSADLSSGSCGAYTAFATIATNPGSPYTDATLLTGKCYEYQLLVTDYVGNVATYAPGAIRRIDATVPTGSIDGSPAGPVSGTVTISGTSGDAHAGVDYVDVAFSGPASGSICSPCATPASWSGSWDTTLLTDGTYTITATVHDLAGNNATFNRNIVVENTDPTASFNNFSEVANPQYQFSTGPVMYVNTNQSGSFTVSFNASDAGVGMDYVGFPDLDGGGANLWSPAGASVPGVSPFGNTYSWSAGAVSPGMKNATAFDAAGNSSTAQFTVESDTATPGGGTISYADGLTALTFRSIAFTQGSDTQSGIDTVKIERSQATLSGGACGAFGGWSVIATNQASPYTNTGLVSGKCYRYRLLVTDKVGNAGSVNTTNTVKVDSATPSVTIASTPLSPFSGVKEVAGTAFDLSGITSVSLSYTGAESGSITTTGTTSWSGNFDTTTVADGAYTLTALATDNLGDTATTTRNILVDNTGADATFGEVVEVSNPQYQHVGDGTIFINPSFSGAFVASVNATDLNGIRRVEFVSIDGSSTSNDLADPFNNLYTWSTGVVSIGSIGVNVVDNAGMVTSISKTLTADADPPAGGVITYSGSSDHNLGLAIFFTVGEDLLSGVSSWSLQRRDASWNGAVCGEFGGWSTIAGGSPASPYTDSAVSQVQCHDYRLVTIDNVGNESSIAGSSSWHSSVALPAQANGGGGSGSGGTDTGAGTVGTNGGDTLYGDADDTTVDGGEGDDTIYGGDNDAEVTGGEGDDTIFDGEGDNVVEGGVGDDTIYSGGGRDTVSGGAGNDRIFGGTGDSSLNGGDGDDVVQGGAGNEKVYGGAGDDRLLGGDGNDFLHGGKGGDVIIGGYGRDRLVGGAGDDLIDVREKSVGAIRGSMRGVDPISVDRRRFRKNKDRVRCGKGVDYVWSDSRDKLSKDCEYVNGKRRRFRK